MKRLSIFVTLFLVLGLVGAGQSATAVSAADYRRVNGVNLDIVDAKSTLQPPKVLATIFNAKACPAYIFYGVRGSEEGYQYAKVKKVGTIAATKQTPERYQYADDTESTPFFRKDAAKKVIVYASPRYGIGTTLSKVFVQLKLQKKFVGKIASAAPYASATDLGGGYNAPPVSALGSGQAGAENYVKSMFVNGAFTNMSSLFFISKACPTSQIIMAGYSQGAFIVSASINAMRTYKWGPETLESVKAVVLLADPAKRKTGLVSQLDALNKQKEVKAAISLIADSVDLVCKLRPRAECLGLTPLSGLMKTFMGYSNKLAVPIGSSILTTFANAKTFDPSPTSKMAISSFNEPRDLVADTAGVLNAVNKYSPTSLAACSRALIICGANLTKGVLSVVDGYNKHSSYAESTSDFIEVKIVPWILSQKTLK